MKIHHNEVLDQVRSETLIVKSSKERNTIFSHYNLLKLLKMKYVVYKIADCKIIEYNA